MNRTPLSFPELAIISGTRAALGAGLGLLLGGRLSAEARKAAGWALFGVGVISTIPIAIQLFRTTRESHDDDSGHRSQPMLEREYAI